MDFTTMTWGLSVLPLLRVAKMVPILTFRSPPTPGVTGPLRVTIPEPIPESVVTKGSNWPDLWSHVASGATKGTWLLLPEGR